MLRKIFGVKKNAISSQWGKLHNTDIHELYSSSNIIRNLRMTEMGRTCSIMELSRNA